jgi:quercetin dioxygenase-like cupin family protein
MVRTRRWETNMSIHHLRFSDLKGVQRGQDIVNYPIVHSKPGAQNLKSGITRIPLGAVVSRHYHDSEEQVTVLEGRLRLKLGDQILECGPYDSTFITAGVPHEFTASATSLLSAWSSMGTPTRSVPSRKRARQSR